jgi:hypothetical protein
MTNTLAYYVMELINTIISLLVPAPGNEKLKGKGFNTLDLLFKVLKRPNQDKSAASFCRQVVT